MHRLFSMLARTAIMGSGPSQNYYLKKCAERLVYTQALLTFARHQADALWAMLRDKRLFTPPVTQTA